MKRFLSIFLIAFFLFQSLGIFLLLKFELKKAGQRALIEISGISELNNLKVFRFSTEEMKGLQWHEEREFRLNSEMYDVVKESVDDLGNRVLYCFRDHRETDLIHFLDQLIQRESQDKNSMAKNIKQLLKLVLTNISPGLNSELRFDRLMYVFTDFRMFSYIDTCIDIPKPPPRYC